MQCTSLRLLLEMPDDVSESLYEWAVIEMLTQCFCDLSFFKWFSGYQDFYETKNPLIYRLSNSFGNLNCCFSTYTVSFRHLLWNRNSASASVVSALKSLYLSVKTTLRLSYRVLKTAVWMSFWYFWEWYNISV
jgi:hypothetical protein